MQQDLDNVVEDAQNEFGLDYCSCEILGIPQQTCASDVSGEYIPGMIVRLRFACIAVEYLLCAHVYNDFWICTRGNFVNGVFQTDDPFGRLSLVMKNIKQNVLTAAQSQRRMRIGPHLHKGQLQEIAVRESEHWDIAVATAIW